MAIPAADTDLLIVIRAIQETITDTKIPGTQAETHPLSELLTISDTVVFNTFCCELCSSIRDCLHHPRIKAQSAILSNEEENAIRYACGYVCMKVLKTLRSSKKANAIQFAECLSNMACDGDESSCTGRA